MKKRLLSLTLTIAILASLFAAFPAPAAQAVTFGPFTVSNMTWSVVINVGDNVGTLYINRSTAPGVPTTVGIPNYTRGSAPWYAHSAQVGSIELGTGISSIGNWAFADFTRVTSVAVQGTITSLGTDAFRECTNLRDFWGNTSGTWAWKTFYGLTSIGDRAFYNCYSLERLLIPDINSVGAEVFVGNRSLVSIEAGDTGNVRTWGAEGLLVGMNSASPQQAVRIIKAPVNLADRIGSNVYTIPDTITLTPNTITTIEVEAFAYVGGSTASLTEVIIPASVTVIKDRAFAYIGTPDPGSPSSLTKATFMGDAPTSANFGTNVFGGINDSDFVIIYFPHGLRWTTPRWNGYRTRTDTSRISLDKYTIVLEVGAESQLSATVFPGSANQDVIWSVIPSTASPGIVSVNGRSGAYDSVAIIKAGATTGMATVRAESQSGAIADCTIIVIDRTISATSVILDKSQINVSINAIIPPDLTAIIYPFPTDLADQVQLASELVWSSSNPVVAIVDTGSQTSLTRGLIIRSVGITTITVATPDGLSKASCVVTVTAGPTFVPVTSVTMGITSMAMGTSINLNDHATVLPANATYNTPPGLNEEPRTITWEIETNLTTVTGASISGGNLTVPWGQTGTVVVDVKVNKGRADTYWGFSRDEPYIQRYTINVAAFIPVTNITNVPLLAFVGRPLQITGTVNPATASFREITWEMKGTTAAAHFDPVNRMLTAQVPGTVTMEATVLNGRVDENGRPIAYTQTFRIMVEPYITTTLTLNANPGGSIYPSGTRQLAAGEELQITASPARGYEFSGFHTTNGGSFSNANSSTTIFTMPGNATTVTAFFTYIGLPGGDPGNSGGGVILPAPVHYFTNNSVYIRNSGVSFGHVTIRDFQLFSHVSLNGRTLTQNAHYTARRTGGYTEIVLANGYLDGLSQGAHTLTVHFRDYVSVTAVFTILWGTQVSQTYTDVFSSDWFFHSVEYVSIRGWMSARSSEPGRFRPSDAITQGEVVDSLYRMAGSPTIVNVNNQVLQGRDASIEWVRSNSILPIAGWINIDSPITRQDMAVLFGRMVAVLRLRYPVVRGAPAFADDWEINPVARSHITDLYRAGIINGRSASTFAPLGTMTRAEFATFLRQFAEAMGYWS